MVVIVCFDDIVGPTLLAEGTTEDDDVIIDRTVEANSAVVNVFLL